MSAKNVWEYDIKRNCIYNNGWLCHHPFSISYGNKEYEVKEHYVLVFDNDEYLEIGEMSGWDDNSGFWANIGRSLLEAQNRKHILWRTITSIDRTN